MFTNSEKNSPKTLSKLISDSKWTELDYESKEFLNGIFAAHEQKLINEDQWATALALYTFANSGKDPKRKLFHQFQLGEGPYDPASLSYSTEENLHKLKSRAEELKKTSPGDNTYFCINLSRKKEIAFIYDILNDRLYNDNKDFFIFLEKYIELASSSASEKQFYLTHLSDLKNSKNKEVRSTARAYLMDYILSKEPDLKSWLVDTGNKIFDLVAEGKDLKECKLTDLEKERSDTLFFAAMVARNQHIPHMVISPDYNPKGDKQSTPTISLILPSMAFFKNFLLDMHGEKEATFPYYMTRAFTPADIRELDENPSKFGVSRQSRPIQLISKDYTTRFVEAHGYFMDFSTLLIHDLYHCLQNSQNIYKSFARYVRSVFENTEGFAMTKGIWEATDMDYTGFYPGSPTLIREAQANKENSIHLETQLIVAILMGCTDGCFFIDSRHDEGLILIIDSIINREKWQAFLDPLDTTPEHLCQHYAKYHFQKTQPVETDLTAEDILLSHKITYEKMQKIIKNFPNQSYSTYILLFRLLELHKIDKGEELLKLNLDELLIWEKNKGLKFKPAITALATELNKPLHEYTRESLTQLLNNFLQLNNSSSFSPLFFNSKKGADSHVENDAKLANQLPFSKLSDDSSPVKIAREKLLMELKEVGMTPEHIQAYLKKRHADVEYSNFLKDFSVCSLDPNKLTSQEYTERSEIWLSVNCWIEALFDSTSAIALDEKNIKARLIRADLRIHFHDFDRAEKELDQCKNLVANNNQADQDKISKLKKKLHREKNNTKACSSIKMNTEKPTLNIVRASSV